MVVATRSTSPGCMRASTAPSARRASARGPEARWASEEGSVHVAQGKEAGTREERGAGVRLGAGEDGREQSGHPRLGGGRVAVERDIGELGGHDPVGVGDGTLEHGPCLCALQMGPERTQEGNPYIAMQASPIEGEEIAISLLGVLIAE